jgi:hypothetical protein
VLVDDGIYQPGTTISLSKAILLEGRNGADSTRIDGQNLHRCLNLSDGATISGLTIQNGYNADSGGGIYCSGSTIQNCTISSN